MLRKKIQLFQLAIIKTAQVTLRHPAFLTDRLHELTSFRYCQLQCHAWELCRQLATEITH